MNTITTTMAFQGVEFKPLRRENQTWLRLPQIEAALGYASKGTSLARIYSRHADEFTRHMTKVIKVSTAGGKQAVRIFSLRGAHLLAMFARTDLAKAFRVWVLDVLDAEVERQNAKIDKAGLDQLKQIMASRVTECVAAIPDPMNRRAAIVTAHTRMATELVCRFGVRDVTQIPAQQFELARDFLATTKVSWELLDDAPKGRYHYPLESCRPTLKRNDGFDHTAQFDIPTLSDPANPRPELDLLRQLERDGHDVRGARVRIIALHHQLKNAAMAVKRMGLWEQRLKNTVEELVTYQGEMGPGAIFDQEPTGLMRSAFASQLPDWKVL